MRNFLANKNNVAVSAYITDKHPSAITTNGALTIIDNSEPSQNITGLVPNSYSIFLDNLFLASGYGFSSFEQFEKASYVVSSYANAYSYILNELDLLHNKSFTLEFDENSDNKIDEVYNTYGWLKEYKEIVIRQSENIANNYTISLNTVSTCYINKIYLEIIGGQNLEMQSSIDKKDLSFNYFEVGKQATVKINFVKENNTAGDSVLFYKTAPLTYLNVTYLNIPDKNSEIIFSNIGDTDEELVNNNNKLINNSNRFYISRAFTCNEFENKDLSLIFTRHDDIIYNYTFKNILKWRYKILAFNTNKINIFTSLDINTIYALDNYPFSNTTIDIVSFESLQQGSSSQYFFEFVENNLDNAIFLDDEMTIEFLGLGYNKGDTIYYMHDYIIVESGIVNFDFYFNGIKNNHWNYLEFEIENTTKKYRIYQSPQRYIGKHTWTIKYNYE